MSLLEQVKEAGVVGAGGAGFPTYAKLNCKAEYILMNGAECEPLLRVDQQLMAMYPDEIIQGFKAAGELVGAQKAIIGIKGKHHDVIEILEEHIKSLGVDQYVSVGILPDIYPAGDEQVLVYQLTGRVVPEAGIPINAAVDGPVGPVPIQEHPGICGAVEQFRMGHAGHFRPGPIAFLVGDGDGVCPLCGGAGKGHCPRRRVCGVLDVRTLHCRHAVDLLLRQLEHSGLPVRGVAHPAQTVEPVHILQQRTFPLWGAGSDGDGHISHHISKGAFLPAVPTFVLVAVEQIDLAAEPEEGGGGLGAGTHRPGCQREIVDIKHDAAKGAEQVLCRSGHAVPGSAEYRRCGLRLVLLRPVVPGLLDVVDGLCPWADL